jgi:hypothetical protein
VPQTNRPESHSNAVKKNYLKTLRTFKSTLRSYQESEMTFFVDNRIVFYIQGASGIEAHFSKLAFSSEEWDRVMKFGQLSI